MKGEQHMIKLATGLAVAAAMLTPAVAQADEPFYVCPSGRAGVATQVTSCPFADNVRQSYFQQGLGSVTAYSPVTGQVYNMWCEPGYTASLNMWPWETTAVRCTGGNNAVVVVW